jgi:hypothetical protein
MPTLLDRIQWISMRLLMVVAATLAVVTFGLSAIVLAPLYAWLLHGDWRFWRHAHRFPRLTLEAARVALRMATDPAYRGMTATLSLKDWVSPPMMGPDLALVKVRGDWPHAKNTCGTCGKCCLKIKCPLFDPVTHFCGAYASPFWRYFPCGRYPATPAQIDYYGCPKWEMRKPVKAPAAIGQEVTELR